MVCVNAATEPGADEMLRFDGFEFLEDDADFVASEISTLGQREELQFWGSLDRIVLAEWGTRMSKVCRLAYGDMTVDEVVAVVAN